LGSWEKERWPGKQKIGKKGFGNLGREKGMSSELAMESKVSLDNLYIPSEDVVAREIEGEVIIVPLVAGIGDMEDELYTMNETGKAVWERLDGKKKLKDVLGELSAEFEAPAGEIEKDVIGLVDELVRRRILVAAA
jgi:hypothetical protein